MTDSTSKQAIHISEEQLRVAMASKEHLIRWIKESNRTWLVFNGVHLAESLPFPEGAEFLTQIVACYRDHRAALDTGEVALVEHQVSGEMVETTIFYPETLTVTEYDKAIRWMIGQISDLDPSWKLTDEPL